VRLDPGVVGEAHSGGRRIFSALWILLLLACLALLTRSIGQRRRVASIATRTGLAERQPAILATARFVESDDDVSALIAWALLEEHEITGGQSRPGKAEEGRELLMEGTARRPGAALYRLLLGRSAPGGGPGIESWEVPLELAVRASPGLDAAPQALAGRYLAAWSMLAADHRSRAQAALQRAFLDPSFAGRQFGAAIDALGPERAVHLLPDDAVVLGTVLKRSEAAGGGPAVELLKARLQRLGSGVASAVRGRSSP
jgi:hypothetical protein